MCGEAGSVCCVAPMMQRDPPRPPSLCPPALGAHFVAHLGAVNKFMAWRGNYVQAFYIKPNGSGP